MTELPAGGQARSEAEWLQVLGPAADSLRQLEAWCKTTDAVVLGRCSHCVLSKTFSASADRIREVKELAAATVGAVHRFKDERTELEATVSELQLIVKEQDQILGDEQEARIALADAMRVAEAEGRRKDRAIGKLRKMAGEVRSSC